MVKLAKRITEAKWFQRFIIVVIVAAGVVVGMETYHGFHERHYTLLHAADLIILWIFTIEIALKLIAKWPRPHHFFKDSWNNFDFVIVALCWVPLGEGTAMFIPVLRLVRILRVFRLVTALPRLQLIVGALLKAIPSMGYVVMLLALHFYIFAAAAVFFFGTNDPWHFGTLQQALLSLFRGVTLEDWTDLMYIQMYGSDHYGYNPEMDAWATAHGFTRVSNPQPVLGALFFVGFIVSGAMVILNLFIGVIMSGMNEMQAEAENEQRAKRRLEAKMTLEDEVHEIDAKIDEIRKSLKVLTTRMTRVIPRQGPDI
ncbi:MAG: ion transporter [Planctomycetes bacterium]|nr:ion transporter [Planctomycetota bacterium]MCW8134636.1 ion transporter [Planctomycetota bacterium]